MPEFTFGENRPPEDAPSYDELTRRMTSSTSRWTGRPCDQIPNGQIFFQQELKDQERYTQAGCTHLGSQPARHAVTLHSTDPRASLFSTSLLDAWCCQQSQVVDVFNAYVQSPEYRQRYYWGLAFAGVMIFGILYLFINRKKLGIKLSGTRTERFSWAARNPGNEDIWDLEEDWDWDEEEDDE